MEDKEELEQFVHSPQVKIYYYDPAVKSSDCPNMTYYRDLEEIKHQVYLMILFLCGTRTSPLPISPLWSCFGPL